MITDEKRREVAENLRYLTIGHSINYKEQFFDELAEVVVGFENYHDFDVVLDKLADLIDPGYRGEIRCKLVNLSDEAYTVYPLERIAQLVFLPFVNAVFTEVDSLPESSRGEDGYGSTGAM